MLCSLLRSWNCWALFRVCELAGKIYSFVSNSTEPQNFPRRSGAWHKISARRLSAAAQKSIVEASTNRDMGTGLRAKISHTRNINALTVRPCTIFGIIYTSYNFSQLFFLGYITRKKTSLIADIIKLCVFYSRDMEDRKICLITPSLPHPLADRDIETIDFVIEEDIADCCRLYMHEIV